MAQKTEQSLAERLIAGDKRALARAITLIENDDPQGWELVREVFPADRPRPDRRSDGSARRGQEHSDRRADRGDA